MCPFFVLAAVSGQGDSDCWVVQRLDVECPLGSADDQMPASVAFDFDCRRLDGRGGFGVIQYAEHIVEESVVDRGAMSIECADRLRFAQNGDH